MPHFKQLSHQQTLNLIDSQQLLEAWMDCVRQHPHYRYGMRWVTTKGHQYLVKIQDATNNGRSLGKRSESTERILKDFTQARKDYRTRLETLKSKLKEQARMNKALRLGRVPKEAAKIIRIINESNLTKDLTIIGTHALFAYESLSGTHLKTELLASGDVDLLIDPRKKITVSAHNLDHDGLLGILRKADKTFRPLGNSTFRAVNDQGFMVDAVMPMGDLRKSSSTAFDSVDMKAVEVPSIHWLVNAPKVTATAIAENGHPLLLRVPDPRAFAIHKAWLSQEISREPLKKPRDLEQAKACYELVVQYMPHLPFDPNHLKFFPRAILDASVNALEDDYSDDDTSADDEPFPALN